MYLWSPSGSAVTCSVSVCCVRNASWILPGDGFRTCFRDSGYMYVCQSTEALRMFTVFPREGGLRILRSVLAVFMARVLEQFWGSVHRYRAGRPCPQGHGSRNLLHTSWCLDKHESRPEQPPQPPQVVCTAAFAHLLRAVL